LILLVKLLLVPMLLAAVTLTGRRFGPTVAGWLGSFPVVAGPVLLIVTLEHGAAFGAQAATAALAGIAPTMGFFVLYAASSQRFQWWLCLPLCWLGWVALVWLVSGLPLELPIAAVAALVGLVVAPLLLKPPPGPATRVVPHGFELPARMLVGAGLALAASALAAAFGAAVAGYTALFPLVGSVVTGFTHALHGRDPTVRFLAGMTRGMWSVGGFCLVLALALRDAGISAAFGLTLAISLVAHALLRPRPSSA
jgi:hypothetical protein